MNDTYNVRSFGAKGDGVAKDTRALQSAIDNAASHGGGTVCFPPGKYVSGSLHLKSHVALLLDHGATLAMSPDAADFDPYEKLDFKTDSDNETSYFHQALIRGEDVEHVAITGTGTIDGNRPKRGGPKPIALKRCKHVVIRDVTMINAPNYNISLLGTDYVNIDGVTILNGYSDGIDPDCCHHVRIANCHIESWDDAIVPKTSFALGPSAVRGVRRSCENLVVTNCVLATNCNAFKLGTESGGDFKYITVSNCVMFQRPNMRPPVSGVALLSVDGANIDGVAISNLSMINVKAPIFLRLGNRGRDGAKEPGSLKNVMFSNIVATGAESGCAISGIPGHMIENVTLRDVRIEAKGGGTLEQTKADVSEEIAKYPSAGMFGALPSHGMYVRHVDGLKLINVQFATAASDLRHAIACDDATNLVIESCDAQQSPGAESVIKFNNVRDATIRNCVPRAGTDVFLKVTHPNSDRITLTGNDLSRARKRYELGEGVRVGSVSEAANR